MRRLERLEAWAVRHPNVPRWLDLLGTFVWGFLVGFGLSSLIGDLL